MKEKEKIDNMKIFSWQAKVGGNVIADGYLLAKDRKEAEEKLKYVPYHERGIIYNLCKDKINL
jgi:hypothetical protein